MIDLSNSITGDKLSKEQQALVLREYVYRFTGDHKPNWATELRLNGEPYPLQFKNDQEWLENTLFRVKLNGELDNRAKTCHSSPTWPNNPELRKGV